jgi:hypothetical protein
MIKAWKLSKTHLAVVINDEPIRVALLESSGLEDRCLSPHESQFHIPVRELHKFAGLLGLGRRAQAALRQTRPGSDLLIAVDRHGSKLSEVQEYVAELEAVSL